MQKNILTKIIVTCTISIVIWLSLSGVGNAEVDRSSIKVIGYVPDYTYDDIEEIVNFSQFTDINYFSIIPTDNGNLEFSESGSSEALKKLVNRGLETNTNIGISIGGWGMSDSFGLATSPQLLNIFVNNIVAFTKEYKVNVVDIDWEYPAVEEAEQLEKLLIELKKKLSEVELSICVPSGVTSENQTLTSWENHFTPKALKTADWVNIMGYDAQTENNEHHSPRAIQQDSLMYWNNLMGGGAMNHLVAGIPFYGKSSSGRVKSYNEIQAVATEGLYSDTYYDNEETYYYNGKKTITEKVKDSLNLKSDGIMIWAPTLDAGLTSDQRLMDVITYEVNNHNVNKKKVGRKIEKESPLLDTTITPKIKGIMITVVVSIYIIGRQWHHGKWLFVIPKKTKKFTIDRKILGYKLSILLLIGVIIICRMALVLPSICMILIGAYTIKIRDLFG